MNDNRNQTLRLERTTVADRPAIAISGPFNANDPRLIELTTEILTEGSREIVVNCEQVSYVTSAGIAALIKMIKRVQAVQGTLYLAGLNEDMKEYFLLIKLDRYLKFI
jgi:anti-anti-sigma factor